MFDTPVTSRLLHFVLPVGLCFTLGLGACDEATTPASDTADVAAGETGTTDAASEITAEVDIQVGPDADSSATETSDAADVSGETLPDGSNTDTGTDTNIDTDTAPQLYALTTNPAWSEVLLDADPYYTDGDPAPDVCPPEDWKTETTPDGVLLEINTSFCAWLTLGQPLLEDVPAGATLRLEVRHAEILDGDTDYQLAVSVGSTSIWAESVEVFELANTFEFEVAAPVAMTAGDTVYFHLENHGANTWNFVSMTAEY